VFCGNSKNTLDCIVLFFFVQPTIKNSLFWLLLLLFHSLLCVCILFYWKNLVHNEIVNEKIEQAKVFELSRRFLYIVYYESSRGMRVLFLIVILLN
jgi:hypothetical protein